VLAARAKWLNQARPAQITPEGDWSTWLILAGRGWGKTRTGAEDAAWFGVSRPGSRMAIVAPTYADARDTCVEGESGLRNVLPPESIEAWNRSLGELLLFNGSRYKLFSADEPERLRGPQFHRAWCDELGAWRYPETWDQLQFGLRLGDNPQVVVTTTPRPTPLVRRLVASGRTRITRGSTFDNAGNLAASALQQLRERYEGTRLGRQELNAEILDDVPGALWTRAMIDDARKPVGPPQMRRVVVAVDPSGTRGDDSGDEIGIVVCGKGVDGRGYVLADRSCRLSPDGWGRRAVDAYREFKADRVVAERNFGGAMVEHVIRTVDRNVSYAEVVASRGKVARAEPIAALYEQKRISHVGPLAELEDQMCALTSDGYLGEGSPDRVDAAVWGLSEVMLQDAGPLIISDQLLAASAGIRRW
jgi:phage terminase large subunit-like protein